MNVLVTGGRGFLGRHVVLELVRRGHAPTILDDDSTCDLEASIPEGVEHISGTLANVIGKVDNLVHLACRYPLEGDISTWTHAHRGYCQDLLDLLNGRLRSLRRAVVGSTLDVFAPERSRGAFGSLAASLRDALLHWHRPPAPSFVMVHMPELFGPGRISPSGLYSVPECSEPWVPRRPYYPDIAHVVDVAREVVDRLEAPLARASIDWTIRGSNFEDESPQYNFPHDRKLHLSRKDIMATYSGQEG